MTKKDKTKIVVLKQSDIDEYNRSIGERIARKKRYGKSATERKKQKSD